MTDRLEVLHSKVKTGSHFCKARIAGMGEYLVVRGYADLPQRGKVRAALCLTLRSA